MGHEHLIRELILDTVDDWDVDLDGAIDGGTRLAADLCFSSIEMMHLLAAIDLRLGRKLPYEKLLQTGAVVRTELTVAELSAFVDSNASGAPEIIVRPA